MYYADILFFSSNKGPEISYQSAGISGLGQVLLAAAGLQGPKPETQIFPDRSLNVPVLVVVSSPFLNKATFAQTPLPLSPKNPTTPYGIQISKPQRSQKKKAVTITNRGTWIS